MRNIEKDLNPRPGQSNYNKVIQDAKLSLVQFGLDIKLRSKLY